MSRTLLRKRQVLERVPVSRTQLERMIRAGLFPRPVAIGERMIAWDSTEIDRWIAERFGEPGQPGAGEND